MTKWDNTKKFATRKIKIHKCCCFDPESWIAIQQFVDAALAVDNLNMSMAREDMEKRISEYNKAKKALLND